MNLGGSEIFVIAGIALLIFGPSQLPKLFRGLGEAFREMKGAAKELVPDDDKPVVQKKDVPTKK